MTETPERPEPETLDICRDCDGSGEDGTPTGVCSRCNGSGGTPRSSAFANPDDLPALLEELAAERMNVRRRVLDDFGTEPLMRESGAILLRQAVSLRSLASQLRASSLGEPVSQEAPWVVWSHERSAWWRANRQGYAGSLFGAGVYSEDEAKAIEDDSHRGDVARLLVDEFERQSRVVGTGANWLRTQLAASRVEAKPQNPCVVFGCECPECSASVISSASPLSEEDAMAMIFEHEAALIAAKDFDSVGNIARLRTAVEVLRDALRAPRLSASAPSPEDTGSDND